MAGSGWRWYSFIVQVLKQQQQKKNTGEKRQKKGKKKASLRMGQSVLWRLLTLAGAVVVIFFVLCLFFVPRGKF